MPASLPAIPIYISIYKDVTNADSLRRQLMDANPDFDYAFLDASMVRNFMWIFLSGFSNIIPSAEFHTIMITAVTSTYAAYSLFSVIAHIYLRKLFQNHQLFLFHASSCIPQIMSSTSRSHLSVLNTNLYHSSLFCAPILNPNPILYIKFCSRPFYSSIPIPIPFPKPYPKFLFQTLLSSHDPKSPTSLSKSILPNSALQVLCPNTHPKAQTLTPKTTSPIP